MSERDLSYPIYKGNEVARDLGAEVRAHEVGENMWRIYSDRKAAYQKSVDPSMSPQELIKDVLDTFQYSDYKALPIREDRHPSDIDLILAYPQFFLSVQPKDISGERKTTEEVSNFPTDIRLHPEFKQNLVFLRNVFAVFLGFVKSHITEEENARIISDRRLKITQLLAESGK